MLEPFCPRILLPPAPGSPSQVEDGVLRQWENPGLVRLHKQKKCTRSSPGQPPAVSRQSLAQISTAGKLGILLIWRRNFQTFQLGAQVGTGCGCGRPHRASLTSITPSSLNLKQLKLLFLKKKVIKASKNPQAKQRSLAWMAWAGTALPGRGEDTEGAQTVLAAAAATWNLTQGCLECQGMILE